jgi:crotonobetainyl-CoA:carnitine CoA-transferase CaiB-like acyl-CoA transferase
MLEETDVVVENFKPGSGLQKIFDYQALSERYPHLITLHISAFGEEGPLRDEPGYDMIAQAAGGLMSLTGEPGGAPMKSGFALGDLGAALFGLVGVLAALVERGRTGRGQCVTTSLYECQLAMHVNWATSYFATGERPTALGSGHPNLAPYQAFPASDGYFVIAVGNDGMWASLCEAIGRSELSSPTATGWRTARVWNENSPAPSHRKPSNTGALFSPNAPYRSHRSGISTRSTPIPTPPRSEWSEPSTIRRSDR